MTVYARSNTVESQSGVPIPGATVTVYNESTDTLASVYSDSAGLTPIAGSTLTTDANGRYTYYAAPGSYYDRIVKSGWISEDVDVDLTGSSDLTVTATGSTTPRSLSDRFTDTLSPLDFGAVGDGVTDDTAAWNAAIAAAAAINGNDRSAGQIIINGGGLSYLISSPINLGGVCHVTLDNAKFIVDAGWSSTSTPVILCGGGGTTRFNTMRHLYIECSTVAAGIFINNASQCTAIDCQVHGFPDYGIRVYGTATESNVIRCEAKQYLFGESGIDTDGNRTAKGISIETSDVLVRDCTAAYCKYPLYMTNIQGGNVIGCHFYNGFSVIPAIKFTVTNIVDNGSGAPRLTVVGHPYDTGDYVVVSWASGIPYPNIHGVWQITKIDADTFDLIGATFAGAYVPGPFPAKVIAWEKEPVNAYIDSASSLNMVGNQFDNGKVVLASYGVNMVGNFWLLSNAGANMNGLEVLVTAANTNLSGLIAHSNKFTGTFPARSIHLTTMGSGSVTAWLACSIMFNHKADGQFAPAHGRVLVGGGTAGGPAITFASSDDQATDWNTGLYQPAFDYMAVSTAGVNRMTWTSTGEVVINHTAAMTVGNSVSSRLQVYGANGQTGITTMRFTDDTLGAHLQLGKSRAGTVGSLSALQLGDRLGAINFFGDDGVDHTNVGAQIHAEAVAAFDATHADSDLVFSTKTGTNLNNVARITSTKHFIPATNAVSDLGVATTNNWRNLYLASSGNLYIGNTQILGTRKTGWTAATGTAARTTFDTATVTTEELAKRVKALLDDLISHGVIGA